MATDNKVKARELFIQGMKLIDIAKQLDIPPGTVRRWKSEQKWGERSDNVNENNERSAKKNRARAEKKAKVIDQEIMQVLENADLTNKQKLFCLHYSRSFNATRSYLKAFECSYAVANVEGCKLLANPSIREEIMKLKELRYARALLTQEDIFQKYMDIAFSDITDYTSFGTREEEWLDKEGNPHSSTVSFVDICESNEVDGSLITEVSMGRNGVKVKLADQMKALDWLASHMNMDTEEQRARIEVLKKQSQIGVVPDGKTGVILMPAVLEEPEEEEGGANE